MSVITINGNHLDPEAQAPTLRAFGLVSEDASKSDYILIQTKEPLSDEQEDELEGLGVVIQEYVSQNTYLCGYKGSDLEVIRSLNSYIDWVNVYLDLFVIQPSLKAPAHATDTMSAFSKVPKSRVLHLVDISLHLDVDPNSHDVQTAIASAARASQDSLTVCPGKIRLNVEQQYLDDVAAVDGVRLIQEVHPAKLFNSKAVSVLKADVPLNGVEYRGEGQVVAVADTGFDKGTIDGCHHAFTGRVKKLYALGRKEKGLADDPDGHGTHVCGSVLGDGNSEKMGGKIQGAAPKATLILQSLLDTRNGLGGIPANFNELFLPPYEEGARVHTNSWGSSGNRQLPYDGSSSGIDRFVWEHPDMVILFAAGNDGIDVNRDGVIDPKQIGSEAAAKNCITVGASENNRPDIPVVYGSRYPAMPLQKDKMADQPDGMAAFSSRGPTKEGRVKPDIVAPGTAILSTRSGHLAKTVNDFGTSSDPEWWFLAGTSMATPLVAGCVAIMRETLVKNGTPNPSAALIKALLINGAVELPGQYVPSEAGPSPNASAGFGRVNVANSIVLPTQTDAGWHEGEPLRKGKGKETPIKITIPAPTQAIAVQGGGSVPCTTSGRATLKVTLVWSDRPGERLQNDLDLIVIAADGTERHGNMGTKPGFDRSNNVEQVVWTDMPPGEAKIIVYAYHIFSKKFPQPYAVAWSINRPLK